MFTSVLIISVSWMAISISYFTQRLYQNSDDNVGLSLLERNFSFCRHSSLCFHKVHRAILWPVWNGWFIYNIHLLTPLSTVFLRYYKVVRFPWETKVGLKETLNIFSSYWGRIKTWFETCNIFYCLQNNLM